MKLDVKLLIGVILCAVASACMSKFDKGGSAYVVRPYIKDGYYTDGTLYFEIDKTEAILIGTAEKVREIVIPDAVGINEVDYPLTKIQNLGVFDKEEYETTKRPNGNDVLTSLVIGGNVKSWGETVFFTDYYETYSDGEDLARRFPRLENIYVKAGNPVYDSRNNCNAIIKSENRELYLGGKNTVVPEGVEKIGASAFRDCEGLKSISFPKTLDVIGAYAFSGSHLQTLTLPENLAYVGQEAFYGCDSLLTISLYCSSVVIEQKAFKKCALLKEPDSEVRCYTPYISVPSPTKVFDEGYNCLMIPKGQRSSFEGWEKCFLTIKEMEK